MNTETFLASILPVEGRRAVVFITEKGSRQFFFDTNAEAAAAIASLDTKVGNVYHGCATYKRDGRKASDVLLVQSFWLDVDCGEGKPYATAREGLIAVNELTKKLGLWEPLVVLSGRGLHVYWPLEAPIEPAQWLPLAGQLKIACRVGGLHAGPERTGDIASILRPVGAHHRKAVPKLVRQITQGEVGSLEQMQSALSDYDVPATVAAPDLDGLGPRPAWVADAANDLATVHEDIPIEPLLQVCSAMKAFADGAPQNEPLWRKTMGVLKGVIDGVKLAHEYSRHDSRYTARATQSKYDSIQGTTTTCDKMAEHWDGCKTCPFRCSSPIVAARQLIKQSTPTPTPAQTATPMRTMVSQYPTPPTGFKFHNNHVVMEVDDPETPNAKKDLNISSVIFYPIARMHDTAGLASMRWRIHTASGNVRDDLILSNDKLHDPKLFGILSQYEIGVTPSMKSKLAGYMNMWVHGIDLRFMTPTKIYDRFGWHDDEFVVGDTMFSANKPPQKVSLTESARDMAKMFEPQGSRDRWVEIIERGFNAPGMEAQQFTVLAGLATPLMKFFPGQRGVFIYMYSIDGGRGKSTAEHCALSAWCAGEKVQLVNKHTTQTAIYARLGMLSSMPFVYDEMTLMDPQAAASMVYSISSGIDKARCVNGGNEVLSDRHWNTFAIGSGNVLLSEKLTLARGSTNAERSRMWEFPVSLDHSPLTPAVAVPLFADLIDNYGWAGREVAQYIVDNHADVERLVRSNFDKFATKFNFTSEERYWGAMLACIVSMHTIATDLGLIKFPYRPMIQFIARTLAENRNSQKTNTGSALSLFDQMLSDLYPGIIITAQKGNNITSNWAIPIQDPIGRKPVGRYIQGDGTDKPEFHIMERAISDWCGKHNTSLQDIVNKGIAAKKVRGRSRFAIGVGTEKYRGLGGPHDCIEIEPPVAAVGANTIPQQGTVTNLPTRVVRGKP